MGRKWQGNQRKSEGHLEEITGKSKGNATEISRKSERNLEENTKKFQGNQKERQEGNQKKIKREALAKLGIVVNRDKNT